MPVAAAVPDSPLAPIASNAPVTLSTGERVAEVVTGRVGSWPFIIAQSLFLLMWFVYGGLPFVVHDPFPWMGANIIMSAEAAFSTSFILIASNVASRRDRAQAARIEHLVAHSESLEEQIAATEQNMVTQLQALSDQLAKMQGQMFVFPNPTTNIPVIPAPQVYPNPYIAPYINHTWTNTNAATNAATNTATTADPTSFSVTLG
jgi:uncharacterized membrane protein